MENNRASEEQIKRIEEMENILNKSTDVFENMNKATKLDKYYSSEKWFIDEEASRNGELPEDLCCRSTFRRFSI